MLVLFVRLREYFQPSCGWNVWWVETLGKPEVGSSACLKIYQRRLTSIESNFGKARMGSWKFDVGALKLSASNRADFHCATKYFKYWIGNERSCKGFATFELTGFGEVGGYKLFAFAKKFVTAQDWRRSDRGQLGWNE